MIDAATLRLRLAAEAPSLWQQLNDKATAWVAPALERLRGATTGGYPKTFNDPIWGEITLLPWETLILDCPLVQRLRNVRQLGMAHLVYPGAGYDRLEHSRGVVEAAERMMTSLERNASFRRRFGKDRDESIPGIHEADRNAVRLAALLHDIGHAAFSHATENVVASRLKNEFDLANALLRGEFEGTKSIAPAEVIAVILVASEALRNIFEHHNFNAWTDDRSELPVAIIARIIGSRSALYAGYLSGVVSGPLDADKLDYMARDSHHAGLPLGLDLHRLISKLEVVTITPQNATNKELRTRAQSAPNQRFYEIGISLSGLGAFEQMMIARVILYDRLYYHHKIRAAEAMVRRLISLAEDERSSKFALGELFLDLPDDTVAEVLGGTLKYEGLEGGGARSKALAHRILGRQIHYRAMAFASRFIAGIDGLPDDEKFDTRAYIWRQLLSQLSSQEDCDKLANKILTKAITLKSKLPDIFGNDPDPSIEDVIVDLPFNRTVASGGDILTRTEDGHVAPPFLFFDPEKWSQAYEAQKQCGFVFAPRNLVKLIGLSARIVFYEEFKAVMGPAADRASKTTGEILPEWFSKAAEAKCCPDDMRLIFESGKPQLAFINHHDLDGAIPHAIRAALPDLSSELAKTFTDCRTAGFPASVQKVILSFIQHAFQLAASLYENGDLKTDALSNERDIQTRVLQYFRDNRLNVSEGAEIAGGETDIILDDLLVVENKLVKQETMNPHDVGEKFSWQCRRYTLALCQSVVAEIVAYKPADEGAILPIGRCISVSQIDDHGTPIVVIRCVLPWNYGNPSSAKPPSV